VQSKDHSKRPRQLQEQQQPQQDDQASEPEEGELVDDDEQQQQQPQHMQQPAPVEGAIQQQVVHVAAAAASPEPSVPPPAGATAPEETAVSSAAPVGLAVTPGPVCEQQQQQQQPDVQQPAPVEAADEEQLGHAAAAAPELAVSPAAPAEHLVSSPGHVSGDADTDSLELLVAAAEPAAAQRSSEASAGTDALANACSDVDSADTTAAPAKPAAAVECAAAGQPAVAAEDGIAAALDKASVAEPSAGAVACSPAHSTQQQLQQQLHSISATTSAAEQQEQVGQQQQMQEQQDVDMQDAAGVEHAAGVHDEMRALPEHVQSPDGPVQEDMQQDSLQEAHQQQQQQQQQLGEELAQLGPASSYHPQQPPQQTAARPSEAPETQQQQQQQYSLAQEASLQQPAVVDGLLIGQGPDQQQQQQPELGQAQQQEQQQLLQDPGCCMAGEQPPEQVDQLQTLTLAQLEVAAAPELAVAKQLQVAEDTADMLAPQQRPPEMQQDGQQPHLQLERAATVLPDVQQAQQTYLQLRDTFEQLRAQVLGQEVLPADDVPPAVVTAPAADAAVEAAGAQAAQPAGHHAAQEAPAGVSLSTDAAHVAAVPAQAPQPKQEAQQEQHHKAHDAEHGLPPKHCAGRRQKKAPTPFHRRRTSATGSAGVTPVGSSGGALSGGGGTAAAATAAAGDGRGASRSASPGALADVDSQHLRQLIEVVLQERQQQQQQQQQGSELPEQQQLMQQQQQQLDARQQQQQQEHQREQQDIFRMMHQLRALEAERMVLQQQIELLGPASAAGPEAVLLAAGDQVMPLLATARRQSCDGAALSPTAAAAAGVTSPQAGAAVDPVQAIQQQLLHQPHPQLASQRVLQDLLAVAQGGELQTQQVCAAAGSGGPGFASPTRHAAGSGACAVAAGRHVQPRPPPLVLPARGPVTFSGTGPEEQQQQQQLCFSPGRGPITATGQLLHLQQQEQQHIAEPLLSPQGPPIAVMTVPANVMLHGLRVIAYELNKVLRDASQLPAGTADVVLQMLDVRNEAESIARVGVVRWWLTAQPGMYVLRS
jgi:hypothetical protein